MTLPLRSLFRYARNRLKGYPLREAGASAGAEAIPGLSYVELEGGHATHFGMCLDAQRRVLRDWSATFSLPKRSSCELENGSRLLDFWLRHGMADRCAREVPGSVLVVTCEGQGNYFHWMFDVVPRLLALRAAGVDFDYVYASRGRRFQEQTLQILGIDPESVIDASEVPFVRAERLVVPSYPHAWRGIPAWAPRLLRKALGHPAEYPNRKFYVSRRDAGRRRILGEEILEGALLEAGFEVVVPSALSVGEQAQTFGEARVVVGPHGAGLSNVVFCPEEAALIEIMPPAYEFPMYREIATLGQLRYVQVVGEGPTGSEGDPWTHQETDYEVSVEKVLEACRSVGA